MREAFFFFDLTIRETETTIYIVGPEFTNLQLSLSHAIIKLETNGLEMIYMTRKNFVLCINTCM